MTKTLLRETDLAAMAKDAIALQLNIPIDWGRSELLVTLPDKGQVPGDAAFAHADMNGDLYGILEAKSSFNRELEAQIMRWAGNVNYAWIAYVQPKIMKPGLLLRIERADRAGVGRVVIIDGVAQVAHVAVFQREADTRLVAAAFHASTGEHDPAAGSAGVKRQTAERAQWEALRKFIVGPPCCGGAGPSTWKDIQHCIPEMRRFTARQARAAIDKGECVGVGYRGNSITEFYAT